VIHARAAALAEAWVRLPRALRGCVPALGMAALWWVSSRSPSGSAPTALGPLLHNAMHVVAYACVAAGLWLAWSTAPVATPQRFRSRGAWSVAALYGVVDEVHQSFVPGRDCSVFDVVSDAAGAALAIAALRGVLCAASAWRRDVALAALAAAGGVLAATYVG